MIHMKKLVIITCTFLSLASALTLKEARKDGKICECPNGLTAMVESKCSDDEKSEVKAIVDATNTIRRSDIRKIANETAVSEVDAGKVIANKLQKKYPGTSCAGQDCPSL